jgi:hypothetical protein
MLVADAIVKEIDNKTALKAMLITITDIYEKYR